MEKKHFGKRIRRLMAPLVCICMAYASAGAAAQARISLSLKNATLREFLSAIEQKSDFRFSYVDKVIGDAKNISLDATDENVEGLLARVLSENGLAYTVSGNTVAIMPADAAQQGGRKKIAGTVRDELGEPVAGANVSEKGTTNGTITDENGAFTLDVASEESVIVISYIGYGNRELAVAGQTSLSVSLAEDTQALEEVVVVGYGVQKKVNLTGAVGLVSSREIENRPIKSVTDALQGATPGLVVQSSSGQPGDFSTFKVRGNTSINSGGALVIVDGIPGSINQVNPNDIESISVLKDAASSAIYGARAAEGVILITTKTAKGDKVVVKYNGNFSIGTPGRIPESNDGYSHALLKNQAYKNAGLSIEFSEEALAAIKDPSILGIPNGNEWTYTSDFDWISYIFDHTFQEMHDISVSSYSEKSKNYISASWFDQNGFYSEFGPDNYDRYTVRLNTTIDIVKDMLILDGKINYSYGNKRYHPQFGSWDIPYITFIQSGPNMPIYDSNGNYSRFRMQANPIQALKEGGEAYDRTSRPEGVFSLTYKPIAGLSIKALGGGSMENNNVREWHRKYAKYNSDGSVRGVYAGQSGNDYITEETAETQYLIGQLSAEYSKSVKKHDFTVLAGWSAEYSHYKYLYGYRQGITGNELPALNLGSSEGQKTNSDEYDWALLSGFARINYAYDNRYLFEANIRADGSSRFSSKHRWGYFPSFSAGWRIGQESFMKEQEIFSDLKIRASWGQLGNQNGLGNYDHIYTYSMSGYYPFKDNDAQWAYVPQLASESRTWETVESFNLGLDMGFLDNRLTFSGELYKKRNKDMLVAFDVTGIIGITVPTGNYGELETKGWEAALGWKDNIGGLSYHASLNISDQKDCLTSYAASSSITAGISQTVEGYPLNSIFGYMTDGLFQTEDEVNSYPKVNNAVGRGDIKYVDANGDGQISAPGDVVYLGNTSPRYTFGVNIGAEYKGFDLNMLFQGVGKRNFYLNYQAVAPFADTWGNYSYTFHNDAWSEDNTGAALPRHYAGGHHNNDYTCDYWMQNAAYVRLKNLQLGYTFDKSTVKIPGLESLRVYLSGDNVFEASKLLSAFDPELNVSNGYMYPITRNWSFGLNVTF